MTSHDDGVPDSTVPWGKAGKGDKLDPYPLLFHLIDTAAVARRLLPVLLGPQARAELVRGLAPLGDPETWVAVLCGLHDLGKYSPAFQALQRELAIARFAGFPVERYFSSINRHRRQLGRTDLPHGQITALHLRRLLTEWGAHAETASVLAAVLGGHHGVQPDSASMGQSAVTLRQHGGETWRRWRDAFVVDFLGLHGLAIPAPDQWGQVRLSWTAAVTLAGLTSVSDWIASDKRGFPTANARISPKEYVHGKVAELADQAVRSLRWTPWRPPSDTRFHRLFPPDRREAGGVVAVRPVQQAVEQTLQGKDRPGVLVVEAPTGEGKTKAATQAVATLINQVGAALREGSVDVGHRLSGFYWGMPSRATSDQVFRELAALLADLDPELRLRLLHGSADLSLAAMGLRERSTADALNPTEVGDGVERETSAESREWFTRKRGTSAPLAVGTGDQALLAAIRSRHVFVRLTGLSGKVVVIDEVHGYDVHMTGLLGRLMMWLGALGTPVVLLSATLPHRQKDLLVRSWLAGRTGEAVTRIRPLSQSTAYPLVTWVEAAPAEVREFRECGLSPLNRARRVRLTRFPEVEKWRLDVAALLDLVGDGGCVAVIHNLVRRVEDTARRLRAVVEQLPEAERPEVIEITGTLTTKERAVTEQRLRDLVGPGGTRRPCVVIGTSVLQEGLDLSFDHIVSDLAPVDALIQRAGRIQRHGDIELPERLLLPTLHLTGVAETGRGPRYPPYTTLVYPEHLLQRTWALIGDRSWLASPDDVRDLVDRVYGEPEAVACPPGWEAGWAAAATKLSRKDFLVEGEVSTLYLPAPVDENLDPSHLTANRRPGRTRKETGSRERRDRH
ncbi:CRISPR-associated helicase Cas3' [Actinoalloteichus caeruleus]|uniref:CRISPR-associated helicase Cas3' n=1 Tax=Actinoalloteichus cyanogriseus TaxID=2893586 RepID=UPI003BB871C5